mmetsp:Transcript_77540/g.122234  ORF Transcript_77540/g.122234 Transcript_77540/m.122234 type:complete len:81 (+) Transcript_77540:335-577(+)
MFEDIFRKIDCTFSSHHQLHWSKLEGGQLAHAKTRFARYLVHMSRTRYGICAMGTVGALPMAGPVPKVMPHPQRCPQQPA